MAAVALPDGAWLISHPAALSHSRHSSNTSLALCQARFPPNVLVHAVSSPGMFFPPRGIDFSPHSSLHSLQGPFLTSWPKLAKPCPAHACPVTQTYDIHSTFIIASLVINSMKLHGGKYLVSHCCVLLGLEQDCCGSLSKNVDWMSDGVFVDGDLPKCRMSYSFDKYLYTEHSAKLKDKWDPVPPSKHSRSNSSVQ